MKQVLREKSGQASFVENSGRPSVMHNDKAINLAIADYARQFPPGILAALA
jgi:hypothetical protein